MRGEEEKEEEESELDWLTGWRLTGDCGKEKEGGGKCDKRIKEGEEENGSRGIRNGGGKSS